MNDLRTDREIMLDILDKLGAKTVSHSEEKVENQSVDNYNKKYFLRFISLASLDVAFFLITALMYSNDSVFFGIALGLFIATLILTFVLLIDWIVIPGETFDKISTNPISVAMLVFIIACSIWVGIFIGEGYSPATLSNEANTGSIERYEQPSNAGSSRTDDSKLGNDRIPNR
jgi:hypothetical protein